MTVISAYVSQPLGGNIQGRPSPTKPMMHFPNSDSPISEHLSESMKNFPN